MEDERWWDEETWWNKGVETSVQLYQLWLKIVEKFTFDNRDDVHIYEIREQLWAIREGLADKFEVEANDAKNN